MAFKGVSLGPPILIVRTFGGPGLQGLQGDQKVTSTDEIKGPFGPFKVVDTNHFVVSMPHRSNISTVAR